VEGDDGERVGAGASTRGRGDLGYCGDGVWGRI